MLTSNLYFSRLVEVNARIVKATASVPPLVKISSEGEAPIAKATLALALSIIFRASRPILWTEDGFAPTSSALIIAVFASGLKGAVAL